MRKFIIVLALLLVTPHLVFASWYNPFSWGIFSKRPELVVPKVTPIATYVNPVNASTTPPTTIATSTGIIPSTTKTQITKPSVKKTPAVVSKILIPSPTHTPEAPPLFSNTIMCNGRSWTSCPAGQRFFCPASGDATCLINTPVPSPQSPVTQQQSADQTLPSPTADQMKRITWMCSLSPEMKANCDKLLPAYLTNKSARDLLDYMAVKAELEFSYKQAQSQIRPIVIPVIINTPPASILPTSADQTKSCNAQHDSAIAALNTSTQQNRNALKNVIASTPSDEYWVDHGLVYSGARVEAEQRKKDAFADLAELETDYQTKSTTIEDTLKSCLSFIH